MFSEGLGRCISIFQNVSHINPPPITGSFVWLSPYLTRTIWFADAPPYFPNIRRSIFPLIPYNQSIFVRFLLKSPSLTVSLPDVYTRVDIVYLKYSRSPKLSRADLDFSCRTLAYMPLFLCKRPSTNARVLELNDCPPHNLIHDITSYPLFYDPLYLPGDHLAVFATSDTFCSWLQSVLVSHTQSCWGCCSSPRAIAVTWLARLHSLCSAHHRIWFRGLYCAAKHVPATFPGRTGTDRLHPRAWCCWRKGRIQSEHLLNACPQAS